MAKHNAIKSLYASAAWQSLRAAVIAERGPICQKCGALITNPSDCHLHHIIELTPENVWDAAIALNPANIQVLCRACHDRAHARFGYESERNVYIVYGAPLSGKSTFVRQNMRRGDLVVDMNALYSAVTMLPEYDKPEVLYANVAGIYNVLLDNVRTRYGKWSNAWVVGGYADKYKRERLAEDLGAELIFREATMEECLRRLDADEARRCRKDDWRGYADKWFDEYQP